MNIDFENQFLKDKAIEFSKNKKLRDDFFKKFQHEYVNHFYYFNSQNWEQIQSLLQSKNSNNLEINWFQQIKMGVDLVEKKEINVDLLSKFTKVGKKEIKKFYSFENLEKDWNILGAKEMNEDLQFLLNFYKVDKFRESFYEKNFNNWNQEKNIFESRYQEKDDGDEIITKKISIKNTIVFSASE